MTDDFDPDWPHGHVVNNRPARIVCTDAKGDYPIVAMVSDVDGSERPYSFTRQGRYYKSGENSLYDLRNAPAPKERVQGWMNVYTKEGGVIYPTKEVADNAPHYGKRFACIYIDVEEGEGL